MSLGMSLACLPQSIILRGMVVLPFCYGIAIRMQVSIFQNVAAFLLLHTR